ncbi:MULTISPECIES: pyridoxamine 5'-phosphate oxidase family protein [unclassified Yoonia]|uniref:pyridoxamine 5'-phosphate oxidase family protein n=1 Tax=unclassified Yoonia TaxID=2629118 RepID=UPI002AFF1429|nr:MULTISPECIES: pyridoxamine 5'-phosphate oxidase family protein [unclassified Yoonia]
MGEYHLKADHIIADEQSLRALFPPVHALAKLKSLPALDDHARAFIRRAPFVCIGTQGADGTADVSPRGDPAGFVAVLDDQTLAIPDRPGNNRLDSLSNIIANPHVGLLFMIPGFDETLRVNGLAALVTDPDVLDQLRVHDRAPRLAIVIRVNEVFLHCAKAFRRSRLWDPAAHQDRAEMPSLMQILLDQTIGAPQDAGEMRKLDDNLEQGYKDSMY